METKRLVLEHTAMMERWSTFNPRLCKNAAATSLWWEVELQAEGGNRLPLRIEYPADYPSTPPNIVVTTTMPAGTPHFLPGNVICWRFPGENKRNRNIWCPSKDTAALCIGVAQRWFYAFLIWLTTGIWPIPDAYATPA